MKNFVIDEWVNLCSIPREIKDKEEFEKYQQNLGKKFKVMNVMENKVVVIERIDDVEDKKITLIVNECNIMHLGESVYLSNCEENNDKIKSDYKKLMKTYTEEKKRNDTLKSVYKIRAIGRKYCNDTEGSDHYKEGGIEPLDLIIAKDMGEDFCLGNIVKYASRFKVTKNLNDIKKVADYAYILAGIIIEEQKS